MKSKKQRLKEKCVAEATRIKLLKHPRCVFCGNKANTCHHAINQSRSNYLKCDERNLISICTNCHCKLHAGYESVMALRLVGLYGEQWRKDMLRDSNIKIKDTLGYWKNMWEELKKRGEEATKSGSSN